MWKNIKERQRGDENQQRRISLKELLRRIFRLGVYIVTARVSQYEREMIENVMK
jgi:hypothetical protein